MISASRRRILVLCCLLTASLVTGGQALAQTIGSTTAGQSPASDAPTWQSPNLRPAQPRPASTDNQLQILAAHSVPYAPPDALRLVRTTSLQVDPAQAEPIGPGVAQGGAQGDGANSPQPIPVPAGTPGSYERIDTGWKPIGTVSASILPPAGTMPANLAEPVFARAGTVVAPINEDHNWPTLSYAWQASAVPHNPLYFEDVNLERYGYSRGILQPWISGGRFFLNVVFLPYHVVAEPPRTIEYPLGYCRPGDRAPPVRQIKPIKLTALAAEAAFVVGMVIILP